MCTVSTSTQYFAYDTGIIYGTIFRVFEYTSAVLVQVPTPYRYVPVLVLYGRIISYWVRVQKVKFRDYEKSIFYVGVYSIAVEAPLYTD